jgi:hypothetical protein
MVHRKNRDLKAELGEAQVNAQLWEDKFIEAQQLIGELRVDCSTRDRLITQHWTTIVDLRAELGQASRELMAVSEQLDVCRRERGDALDKLTRTRQRYNLIPSMPTREHYHRFAVETMNDIEGWCTEDGDTSESEAMRKELDAIANTPLPVGEALKAMERQGMRQLIGELGDAMGDMIAGSGVAEMHTTCRHFVRELPDQAGNHISAELVHVGGFPLSDRLFAGDERGEDPDLNESDEFEVVQP